MAFATPSRVDLGPLVRQRFRQALRWFRDFGLIVKDCLVRSIGTWVPDMRDVAVIVDVGRVGLLPTRSADLHLRYIAAITLNVAMALILTPLPATAGEGLIDGDLLAPVNLVDLTEPATSGDISLCNCACREAGGLGTGSDVGAGGAACGCPIHGGASADGLSWLHQVRVGYDDGFVIASRRNCDLNTSRYPFRMQMNGWGQLRYTASDVAPPNNNLNQFQLKRARLIFSGHAFDPDFSFFVQLDGRSSSGDNMRLLDYYLSYDVGHDQFGLCPGTLGFRTGKFKMPFSMARWLSGKQFEFTDRSVASTYFDVNRSLAWGLYGQTERLRMPIHWEMAIFNGFVTGGAETGSSGDLDDNFAYSGRLSAYPIGDWGASELADFEWHERLAMRVGCAVADTTINRAGVDGVQHIASRGFRRHVGFDSAPRGRQLQRIAVRSGRLV